MKTINPFKRRNKEDFIPCSLFPASKVCDTSLPIGRAVPLYALDMVAGNRVSLDVSQLTRFQPMLAPVMTNYSVEFGAFYVPYVAFDEFFSSTWFRTNMQGTDVLRSGVLRAREFFNPAIESSQKVHPWFFTTKRCGDKVNWVGSLYDHLRAPLGLPDWSTDKIYSSSAVPADDTSVVDDFLSQHVFAGNLDYGAISSLLSNKSSIYPYLSGDRRRWNVNGKWIPNLIISIIKAQALNDSSVLKSITDFLTSSKVFRYFVPGNTSYEDVNAVDAFGDAQNYDYSYMGNSSDTGVSFNSGIFVTLFAWLEGLGFTKTRNGTSSAQLPYRVDCSNWSSAVNVDKFYKWLYKEITGKAASGTFTLSSGVVSYSVSSGSSPSSSYGLTALSSLISSSIYAQADGFSNGDNSVISLTSDYRGEILGFVPFVLDRYGLLDDNSIWQLVRGNLGKQYNIAPSGNVQYVNGLAALAAYYQRIAQTVDNDQKVFQRVWSSVTLYLFGFDPSDGRFDSLIPYDDLFGKTTIVQLQQAYRSYIESLWISANRNLSWNSVYWLCYQRIYADWFLNEHYTKHEDYLDMIGSGYLAGFQSLEISDGKVMTDWFAAGQIDNGNNPKVAADNTLSYFADRVAAGECMPVLWSLDCVTNLIQSTTTSSTPIGQSITENFYNRFYARFKDLINRMGPDYRRNARALYGKGPDDASLLRSQVVGYRSFDVQIGDVAQNSESTRNSTLGQFAGYAVSRDKAGSFDWTAQESGVFMVLAWVRPKYTCFADLVPRSLYKSEYMDYLIPQFGGVGYQDFAYKQLCPTSDNPDSRLGYEERYSEYMMMDNECSGLMRTSMSYYNSNRIGTPCYTPGTADFYHLLYMDEESDLQRVFVDNVNDPVLISVYFNGNVTRQLPASIKTEF